MADKITYHSAITGKFVTKKYAEKNPDTTVELSNCNLRQELIDFFLFFRDNGESQIGKTIENFIDDYLEEK
jgi:hypothetical protein